MGLKDKAKKGILDALNELEDIIPEKSNINIEVKNYRGIEENCHKSDEYEFYRNVSVNYSRNGDKYKVNYSFDEETVQKAQYMLITGGFNLKDNSRIPTLAILLLYEVHNTLKKNGVDLLKNRLKPSEIIKQLIALQTNRNDLTI